ncbi:MAG: c-type cytochrome [Gammaproteobacteria bacterium]|nr:c-type cytochrome [Gammaproteobacteria bacterium]
MFALPSVSYSVGISNAELSATTCFMCHGPEGKYVGGTIPPLAGYPESVMVTQLKAIKSGARKSTVMQRHIKGYSDAEIEELAKYFSSLKP